MSNLPASGELGYQYPPSRALIAAAKELGDIDPTPELSQLTNKGVFDLARRALREFCGADIENFMKPQTEATETEIAKRYDTVYKTAVSGLYWILAKGGRVEVTDEMVEQFAATLPQQIDQAPPDATLEFIVDQTALQRMLGVITAVDKFVKYKKYQDNPSGPNAKLASLGKDE